MSRAKFKTMRHTETVRNYLNRTIVHLLRRQEQHDQTKLQAPEVNIFERYTHKLKDCTYGSDKYKRYMKEMKPAIDHHNEYNRHHPEHFNNGIKGMNLIDLLEMICDWKAASLRHNDGNIMKSIEINKKRFGYSDELAEILRNTVKYLDADKIYHHAEES